MPNYDYECDRCHVRYELRQGFDAPSSHTCEECGQGNAKRVLTAPRVVFKGSGWYVTDSRKPGSTSEAGTTSSPSPAPASAAPAESAASSAGESASASAAS